MATGPASSNVILYGTDEPPAPIRPFALGPLGFDLESGKLRYIRFDGHEALRAIAFVVRGPSWESPPPKFPNWKPMRETATSYSLSRPLRDRRRPPGGYRHDRC